MSLSQEIESRIAILDIVNRYVQTKKAGVNYKALCPFHNEKTASFVISPAKNYAKCFSCGKGGGPIRFLMEIENIEYREAAAILAKEAGIELKTGFASQTVEKGKDPYLLYKMATEWYKEQLFGVVGSEALSYLEKRGLSHKTIQDFGIGFASNSSELKKFLLSQGFDSSFLVDSGLFASQSRDKFLGRVVFPIANSMGNTVAFTGRILGAGEPKYLNSPASRIFDKSSILYGLHLAKQTISKKGEVFIVEGQMDVIAMHQAGITNTVGISGTALTQEHIKILKRFTKVVYLALDADSAGVKATFLSIDNLLNSDLEIRVILIPNGKDPDEFLKSGGDFEELKSQSLSVIEYYVTMGEKEFNLNTLVGQKQLIEKCIDLILHIASPIETEFYLKQLSELFQISRDSLYQTLGQRKNKVQKQILEAQKQLPEVTQYKPSHFHLLAGLIVKFSLLDLFFQKFAYNIEDISRLQGASLLYTVIANKERDDSDAEELKSIDLYIDERLPDQHPEIIQKHFFDLLRVLHTRLLEEEKTRVLAGISVESPEYLTACTYLIQKSKNLGIPQGKITIF